MKRALGVVALLLCITGCAQSAQSTSTSSAAPSPQATNPIDFPLYSGSTVLAARDWRGANGSGASVSGREVIAESSASLDTLEAWLHDVSANPPAGFTVAVSGSGADAAHRHAQAMGLQFQVFSHEVGGKTRGLVVVVLDPAMFETKAGPVLSLIDKYSLLPQSFRDPIDQQAKARTGFTVSQALDPSQPIGAALAAARALRDSGQRGVVLVDGAKN
ncbi:MAG: hypothetical protein ABR949_10640 [Candidatus Aquilonibacter sp.]|jgi:hypothetical protein